MLGMVLQAGALVGAALGTFHAFGVFALRRRTLIRQGLSAPRAAARAAYPALWTLVLWTLFGSYVLVLWLLSVPLWLGLRTAKAV